MARIRFWFLCSLRNFNEFRAMIQIYCNAEHVRTSVIMLFVVFSGVERQIRDFSMTISFALALSVSLSLSRNNNVYINGKKDIHL